MNYCGNITKSVMLWEIFVDLLMRRALKQDRSLGHDDRPSVASDCFTWTLGLTNLDRCRHSGDVGHDPNNHLHASGSSNCADTQDLEADFAKIGCVRPVLFCTC